MAGMACYADWHTERGCDGNQPQQDALHYRLKNTEIPLYDALRLVRCAHTAALRRQFMERSSAA